MLPVLMTEHVALRLLKREIPATPGTAYAKVYLHLDGAEQGAIPGLYMLVEDIDRAAVKRYFGHNDGRLIKSTKDNCNNEVEFDDGPPNEAAAAWDAFMPRTRPTIPRPALAGRGREGGGPRHPAAPGSHSRDPGQRRRHHPDRGQPSERGPQLLHLRPQAGRRQYMPWDVDLTFGQQHGNCAPPPDGVATPGSAMLMCSPDEPLFRWCPDSLSAIGKRTVCVKPEEPQEIRSATSRSCASSPRAACPPTRW